MAQDPKEKAKRLAEKIGREIKRSSGKGLQAAAFFLAARTKETASVKAPMMVSESFLRVQNRWRIGRMEPAKPRPTRAKPGAPLRVVTGRFRTSITAQMQSELVAWVGANARSEEGWNYPLHHEIENPAHPSSGQHKTFQPTFARFHDAAARIIGRAVKIEVG